MRAMLLYFASVLDLATTDCFLDLQEIRLGQERQLLQKWASPEVDLLSLGSEAQSASQ